jgi:hypothetical protein
MLEVYVLVPVRRSFVTVILGILSLALAVLALLLSCATIVAIPFVVVFGGLWYFLTFKAYKEFEYSYFDGEVRFAKVMNKSRRKRIAVYSMEEVAIIAPAGDRSVYKYENDHGVSVKDYTSHKKEVPYYEMIVNKDGATQLIKFEPDQKYLDAVEQKYRQKLIRMQEA